MLLNRVCAGSLAAFAVAGSMPLVRAPGGVGAGHEAGPPVPYAQIFGPDSRVTRSGFHRIRDQQAWETLWADHAGRDAAVIAGVSTAPAIDFDRCEVIACFRGPTTNIRGERVEAVEDLGAEGRRIRFNSSTYQTFAMAGEDPGVRCTPFGFWIIDRTRGPIVIEENVQNLKDEPPAWRHRERLDAPG
jgi:hypothetical protein